ncbi:MAG: hypothetical protein LUF91_01135 [Oscillospiraceae bacterium]|nr:hypothetical protein [Oscillospiraceae bacterium]
MSPDKAELQQLLHDIHGIASSLGIHINEQKTRIVPMSRTFKYLQIKYTVTDSGKIIKRINPARVTNMRRKLKKIAVKFQNGEWEYAYIENMFRSWMGSFYKLMSRQQRENMISLYEDLFNKTVSIQHKKMIIMEREAA